MSLNQFIINDLTPTGPDTLVGELHDVFKGLTYSHIPVLEEGVYLGCLSETDVFCFEPSDKVNVVMYAIEGFYVRNSTAWLTVLEAFAENDSNIMPVLDSDNKYLGYYQLNDIISMFNHTPFFSEPGGVILVEKNNIDFSFSELSQIIESNNAKMLGAFISKMDGELTQITIKIGSSSLTTIFQDFRRYGYTIVSGHEDDGFLQTLKERSAYLNNYLSQ
jgi:predicted transcriptional regulator